MRTYRQQLDDELKRAQKRYEEAVRKMIDNPTEENIRNRNNAGIDVVTAKSRIENLGKNRDGMEEYHLPNTD
ncbi:MAG: hypothetical protein M9916_01965 [Crocinitomicaceae bacterium]|jgi:hypothetical protein|nr:hypothetical protein [Crocinitomicaceae bacterium]